ncbi:MAG: glycosyltransferase family 4 protein [Bacteroidia bacterium]|nr:glycosyltransferase family 4 protein [Bacteroidia bacterium]
MLFRKKIYQQASALVALSPGIAEGILRVVPKKSVHIIPNLADCRFFVPSPKPLTLLDQYRLHDKFTISYLGTLGEANHLEYLLEVAQYFQQRQIRSVHFLIMGKGKCEDALRQRAAAWQLENLSWVGYGNKYQTREILYLSDAVYVSFLPHPVLESSSPNKFFDALAAGRMCIINLKGWLKDLVETHQCGFYTKPGNPEDFYQKLLPFLQSPKLCQSYQKNARYLAEQAFARELMEAKFLAMIQARS